MDFKICEQLKNKGFRQFGSGTYIRRHNTEQIYQPQLSELIFELGEGDFVLKRTGNVWRAFITKENMIYCKEGELPQDAVGKLWLHLINKKND